MSDFLKDKAKRFSKIWPNQNENQFLKVGLNLKEICFPGSFGFL